MQTYLPWRKERVRERVMCKEREAWGGGGEFFCFFASDELCKQLALFYCDIVVVRYVFVVLIITLTVTAYY